MNPNGAAKVQANLQLGFRVAILNWLPDLLIPLGAVLLLAAVYLVRRNRS
jgi:hypothetical protein